MSDNSSIEWTDATWNPIRARLKEKIGTKAKGSLGWYCEHATTGCEHCYAEGMNKRLGTGLAFKPGHRGDVDIFLDQTMLTLPLRWKKPRTIFVCSMTDMFADFVEDQWLDQMFGVMALTPQHTYQILTKRPARMQSYLASIAADYDEFSLFRWADASARLCKDGDGAFAQIMNAGWPLPNVWLGVSTERQQEADERIPLLLQTPAAVRFISAEPLLGPIDISDYLVETARTNWDSYLNWVIAGGESGKSARPTHPGWLISLRDQCEASPDVAFFFKQWGEWGPCDGINVCMQHALCGTLGEPPSIERNWSRALDFFQKSKRVDGAFVLCRMGKSSAGRHLAGKLHDAMPKAPGTPPAYFSKERQARRT